MDFRTKIAPIKTNYKIDHRQSILLSGSCFAENIGSMLKERKFDVLINPMGINYHPIAIHNSITAQTSDYNNFQEREGNYFHYQLHSQFNQTAAKNIQEKINEAIEIQNKQLEKASVIVISYGTARVHELISNNELVSNCHKQPASLFRSRYLKIQEIVNSFNKLKLALKEQFKKDFQFILTISPVRHLKEGFRENTISKSILHLAIDQLVNENSNCFYFPSYEIMMDDLRGYRFYKDDLIHPTEFAVKYIWKIFEESFCAEDSKIINEKINGFKQSINHKAFQPNSAKHIAFLKNLKEQLIAFQTTNQIDFHAEIARIEREIRSI